MKRKGIEGDKGEGQMVEEGLDLERECQEGVRSGSEILDRWTAGPRGIGRSPRCFNSENDKGSSLPPVLPSSTSNATGRVGGRQPQSDSDQPLTPSRAV